MSRTRGSGAADATRARFDVGDPLRALAALAVFAIHAVSGAVHASGYDHLLGARDHFASLFGFPGYVFDSLNAGVSVFFVLSGYLLSRPFLRAWIEREPLPSVPRYLRNRALRILPAFWVVLALALVLFGTGGDTFWQSAGLAVFWTSFTTSGIHDVFGQPWSLAVEARFYLLLPLAALVLAGLGAALGDRLTRAARIALVLVLVAAGFAASVTSDAPAASFRGAGFFFAPGILLAVLEHVLAPVVRARPRIRHAAMPLFAAGVAIALTFNFLALEVLSPPWARYLVPLATGLVVGAPLLWQWAGGPAWRALDNRVLHWIGQRSYSLFLVHSLVVAGLAPHLVSGGYWRTLLVVTPVTLACSLAAAALLHRWVERPALQLKARDDTGATTTRAPAVGEPVAAGASTAG